MTWDGSTTAVYRPRGGSHETPSVYAVQRRSGTVELRRLGAAAKFAWYWLAPGALILLLALSEGSQPELVVLGALAFGFWGYKLPGASVSSASSSIEGQSPEEIFGESSIELTADDVTEVELDDPTHPSKYGGVRFEYGGERYYFTGPPGVVEGIGEALHEPEPSGRDVVAEPAETSDQSDGPGPAPKRPSGEDAFRR